MGVNIEPQKLRRRWHGSFNVLSIKSVVYGIYLLTAFFVEIGLKNEPCEALRIILF